MASQESVSGLKISSAEAVTSLQSEQPARLQSGAERRSLVLGEEATSETAGAIAAARDSARDSALQSQQAHPEFQQAVNIPLHSGV